MRIFLTGATGYVGSAVLDALLRAEHDVTALVRDVNRGKEVAARGARPALGDLAEPASFQELAEGYDAYVHAAFDRSARGPEIDQAAVDTFLALAVKPRTASEPRLVVYTSGVWLLGRTAEAADEEAPLNPTPLVAWRAEVEARVVSENRSSLRAVVVRPGIVFGGTRGIVSDLLRDGRNGLIRIVGDGENRWPLVYDRDLGDLYARLVEDPTAQGVFHATNDNEERVNAIADALADDLPTRPDVRHVPIAEARAKMGPFADALVLDQVVRSPRARALGWTPGVTSVGRNVSRLLDEFRGNQEDDSAYEPARR